jgi:uncharacterized protein YecE (DUF72 family)
MIHIGTSGWSYDHWVGLFYPEDLKKNEWLPFYSRHFDTVELNMSFYRYPFRNMLKGWKRKLPGHFRMTFKAHRQITHRKKFRDAGEELAKFYQTVGEMDKQAGCILFQTPPSFRKEEHHISVLTEFLQNTQPERNNVIEFRHPSWWDRDTLELLQRFGAGFCTVSGLDMPSKVMHSTNMGYFRFHGPEKAYASSYTEEQLRSWADTIRDLMAKKEIEEAYCYFNNDFHGYAIQNAKQLAEYLDQE